MIALAESGYHDPVNIGNPNEFTLLELANPSQPLLRRLLLETPGTYHHSLLVANLSAKP